MWERWLFAEHPQAELRAWAHRLRWFRFVRASTSTDGDLLLAVADLRDSGGVEAAIAELGIDEGDGQSAGGIEVDRDGGRLTLVLHGTGGKPGTVGAADVTAAVTIEECCSDALLASAVDPPLDDRRCVCPKWHPNLFQVGDGAGSSRR